MKKVALALMVAVFAALGAGVAFAHNESPIDGVHPNFRMGAQDPSVAPGVNLPIGSIFRKDASHYYLKVGTQATDWELIGTGGGGTADVSVVTFGALCNGTTNDTAAITAALTFANVTGGTITVPAGKTCLVRQLNFGALPGIARGVRLRGAAQDAAAPSTILIQPATVQGGDCTMLTNNTTSATANGGVVMGPDVTRVTVEDLRLQAGGNLRNCIVNASHTTTSSPLGDPAYLTFRRVQFKGNALGSTSNTHDSVFVGHASWLTFEECIFASGSNHMVREDGASGYFTSPRFTGNLFAPGDTSANQAVSLQSPTNIQMDGNTFEVSAYAVYVGFSYSGSYTNNFFNMEGQASAAGRYFMDIGCGGCLISGNWFTANVDAINVRAASGRISNNYFIGQSGTVVKISSTPSVVDGISVENNYFHGGSGGAIIDIDVRSGKGHRITGNRHVAAGGQTVAFRSAILRAGTQGYLETNVNLDTSTAGVQNLTSAGDWFFFADQIHSGFKLEAAFATGLLKHATSTGVLSIAAENTDFASPSATYVVKTSTLAPPNAQVLASLSSGLLKVAATTGVLSTATAGSDYENPLTFASGLTRTTNAVANDLITGKSGGNTITCGTASGNGCTITSTSNATKGTIQLGTASNDLLVDQANHVVKIGVPETPAVPTAPLQVYGAGNTFSIVRNATNDVEVATGALSSSGLVNTQTAHNMCVGANNGAQFCVDTSGHILGTALHDNGSVPTGTTQYIASGTWTPTLTSVANVDGTTPHICQWLRVGRVVNFSCQIGVDPTAGATLTRVRVSLPIATNLASTIDLVGACGVREVAGYVGAIVGDGTNDAGELNFTTVADVASREWFCSGSYLVN